MTTIRRAARGARDIQPKDVEFRQGLVTVTREFDTNAVTTLSTASSTEPLAYPIGSKPYYDIAQSEIVFSLKQSDVAGNVSTQRRAPKTARYGVPTSTGPTENLQRGVTCLNGWRFPAGVDPTTLSDEQFRSAVLNSVHILGLADKSFSAADGDAGRKFLTQISGNVPMFGDSEMPLGALVEVTVPTRQEALDQKYSRAKQGIEPVDKVTLITRPVDGDTLAVEFTTNLQWFLSSPEQFRAAMDPRIRETQTWEASCQATASHATQALVVGLPWLQTWGATATWPLFKQPDGTLREIDDNDVYARAQNEGSHMFYAAVGFADGRRVVETAPASAQPDGRTAAGRMRELRRRLREEPSSFAEALALAIKHVRPLDTTTTVGVPGAPTAIVDPRALEWFAGGRPNSRAAETFSFQQSFLRSVFWDSSAKSFMFGTRPSGENRHVDITTGKPRFQTPGGRLIQLQKDSFHRFVAAVSNAKTIQDSRIIGRVTRAGHANQRYTMFLSKEI